MRVTRPRALPWAVVSAVLIGLAAFAGWWMRGRTVTQPPQWSAELLGGPRNAMGPRISPDGHTLAFQAFVDGLTQVAVMDTQSGDWTVLTKNRTRGYVSEISWSPDGSQIYFDRYFSVPRGIYSVSRLGGDERQVLKDAFGPEALPDGSLLVVMRNKDRNFQLQRFWPDTGRMETLDALPQAEDMCPAVRAFHDGKEAVFFGKTLEQNQDDPFRHLYVLNLASGKSRRLAPQLPLRASTVLPLFPLAVTPDDRSVLVDLMSGDLHRIIAIPRDGRGPVRTLLTLTSTPVSLDMSRGGDLYMDRVERPTEILRFSASGGTPESLESFQQPTNHAVPLQLPDGRIVFGARAAGRSVLLAGMAGSEPVPFVQTKEETWEPACQLGDADLAFRLGAPSHLVVAVASVADGRIIRRLKGIPADDISSLAASPDGKMLYYAASGFVWAVPAIGGQPRKLAPGDFVAADPNGKDLIVQVIGKDAIRLVRVPVSGGAGQPIPVHSDFRLTTSDLSPQAVGKDGRVVISIAAVDTWNYRAGVLDPRSGKISRVRLNFSGDVLAPGWLKDGRILATGNPSSMTLWRFHPTSSREP